MVLINYIKKRIKQAGKNHDLVNGNFCLMNGLIYGMNCDPLFELSQKRNHNLSLPNLALILHCISTTPVSSSMDNRIVL